MKRPPLWWGKWVTGVLVTCLLLVLFVPKVEPPPTPPVKKKKLSTERLQKAELPPGNRPGGFFLYVPKTGYNKRHDPPIHRQDSFCSTSLPYDDVLVGICPR